jgi:hypothetical protein
VPTPLPSDYEAARTSLHLVAVHVLARRRSAASGRFGLRPTPGGFGTPAFGDPDHEETLRVAGGVLVREQRLADGMHTTVHPIDGATLAELTAFAGADLSVPHTVGRDTPDPGDTGAPLAVAPAAATVVAGWFDLGARAIDRLLAELGPNAGPSVVQIWPEHFDLGIDVAAGETRANLGASPGDGYCPDPYVYVGPWSADRPGEPEFWNAPFGAFIAYDAVAGAPDPVAAVTEFLHRGLDLLAR